MLSFDLRDRPDHPFVLFNLGMTAHYSSEHKKAVDWLRQSAAVSADAESHLRKAYALMGASLRNLERIDEAEAAYREGLTRVPDDPEILFGLASIAASRGDHRGAIELYQASLDADVSGAFVSLDPGIRGWKARHNMAVSHVSLEDWPSARELWRRAMIEERRIEAAHALFASGLEQGDLFACRDVLAWIRDAVGDQRTHWEMARALTNAAGFQLQ